MSKSKKSSDAVDYGATPVTSDPASGVDLSLLPAPLSTAITAAPPLPSCVPGHDGRLYPRMGASIRECPHNLDLSQPAHKAIMFNLGNPSDLVVGDGQKDEQGRPYIIVIARYYVVYPDDFTDPDTGEVTSGARTCLITPEGKTFKTTSSHAPHRIQVALDLYSPADWDHGIRFRITERKSRNTQRQSPYHDIRIEM